MKKSLLLKSFAVLILLFIVHLIGLKFYLYWDLRWFDSVADFLGGLSVGLFSIWVLFVSGIFGKHHPTKKQIFFSSIVCGMLVGTGWEIFEYVYHIANPIGSYQVDTTFDLLADFVGAVVAGWIGRTRTYYE